MHGWLGRPPGAAVPPVTAVRAKLHRVMRLPAALVRAGGRFTSQRTHGTYTSGIHSRSQFSSADSSSTRAGTAADTLVFVERADPTAAKPLLLASHALMESLFPPEDNHYLSLDALRAPNICFFVARSGSSSCSGAAAAGAGGDDSSSAGKVLGCGALAVCGEAGEKFGELKSMYTDSAARGCGVGGALLARLEEEAQLERLQCLRLETGNKLHAALSFYRGAGFVERGPFGMYEANGTSLFMEKALPHETR